MTRSKYSWQSAFMRQHEQALAHPREKAFSQLRTVGTGCLKRHLHNIFGYHPFYSHGCPSKPLFADCLKREGKTLSAVFHAYSSPYKLPLNFLKNILQVFPVLDYSGWQFSRFQLEHFMWLIPWVLFWFSEMFPKYSLALFPLLIHNFVMLVAQ